MQKLAPLLLLLPVFLSLFFILSNANQAQYLQNLIIRSRKSPTGFRSWSQLHAIKQLDSVFISSQDGHMQADKIDKLPGQPDNVDFDQYSGYVTVDPQNGRALFYYFVESPTNSSTNPLLLWLNGGPGCSSLGFGAMQELGPFRVKSDGKTLFKNNYAWNNVANVIFLESPVTVGFSYSNTSSDCQNTGDTSTANDAYTFLINWLERFPQYKTRDFYITGESYAGHYVPQLAYAILLNNKNSSSESVINLKGVAVGNSYMDDATFGPGAYDYLWTHALNSDEAHAGISKYCDFSNETLSDQCYLYMSQSYYEIGNIEINNIYAPVCLKPGKKHSSNGSVDSFDPCSYVHVDHYLNSAKVQRALHAKPTIWSFCKLYNWTDQATTVLPIFENLIASGIRVWLYSGDVDSNVPVTTTRYAINSLNIPVETAWRPWYLDNEVGGYVEGYKGLTFVTVRGGGHEVPSYQPERALTMISSFLQGILPPSS